MPLHEKRKCKCLEHRGDESWHGGRQGYHYHYCRCDDCKAVSRLRSSAYREANPERARGYSRTWRQRNPELDKALRAERHAAAPVARRRGMERQKQKDSAISQAATRRGPWDAIEDATASRRDLTAADVARVLSRTVPSVVGRRKRLREMGS